MQDNPARYIGSGAQNRLDKVLLKPLIAMIVVVLVGADIKIAVAGTYFIEMSHCKNPSLAKEPRDDHYIMGYFVAGGLQRILGFGVICAAHPFPSATYQNRRKAALMLIFLGMGL